MSQRALEIQELDRKRISRELHDEIAQLLTGIGVELAILRQTSAEKHSGLRRSIAKAQRFVANSVNVVHRFATELRPPALDDLGLVPALRAHIRAMPGRRSLLVRLESDGCDGALDSAKRTALYRVVQEALANVVRHARATRVVIRIRKTDERIELVIHDNGQGFDTEKVLASTAGKHLGLLGMQERVDMVGGTLVIASGPRSGTSLAVSVPLGRSRHGVGR